MSRTPDVRTGAPLADLRGVILDMDGVLIRGRAALPGVQEFFKLLRARDISLVIASNNSTPTIEQVLERVNAAGADARPREILTSSQATADYLKEHLPAVHSVYAIGEEGLSAALKADGLELAVSHRQAEAVVVGMCRSLTWEMLVEAALAIRAGAHFIGTNPDRTFPAEIGIIPGAGSILAALQAATDREPLIIGKPEPYLFRAALARLGTPAELTAVVGDRLETDILGGQNVGLRTILVLTGVTTASQLSGATLMPDWTFDDLPALCRALERGAR